MIVKGLIPNINTDSELTALTGMNNNSFAFHVAKDSVYIYESNFKTGNIDSIDGGCWIKENFIALSLEEYKAVRFKEIDARTGELISNGFAYNGLVFSLSQNAQINILGMDSTRDDPAMTYPIEYSTLDDLAHYSVVDADDLHAMYLTALGTKKYFVDSGTILKDAVRSAVDEQAVELIIDNR